ncbi:peroxide stress protein YaaA [Micrococcus sp.]|uniref:YaaA family protein n=1 Tax=Micrococcus sp. TaxID=1271 RepID=UPI002A91EAAE|nr:peroxide stress protein YaaA [Micrococcus sp.]MDY6054329.1 peroxide stress protein YaaA [Micrococcus sp.]
MLILLPPSEGKTAPRSGRTLDLDSLALAEDGAITAARRDLIDRLAALSAGPDALDLLGVGPSLAGEVTANTALTTAPTAPGHRVFTGVLFEALDHASLSAAAKRRARSHALVFSALFGVTTLADRIPAHRLSVGATVPGLPGLAAHWRPLLGPGLDALAEDCAGPVVDCRSGGYAALWKAPAERTLTVDVVQLRAGRRTVVSHFAKHTRGLVARVLLEAGSRATNTLERTAQTVAQAGDGSDDGGPRWEVELIPPAGRQPGSLQIILPEKG